MMGIQTRVSLLVALLAFQFVMAQNTVEISSPDGNLGANIFISDDGQLQYTLTAGATSVIEPAALGIAFNKMTVGTHVTRIGEANYQRATATLFHEKVIQVVDSSTTFQLVVRMFNDGLAYRYVLPEDDMWHIERELSSFCLPEGSRIWFFERGNNYKLKSYAGEWVSADIGEMPGISPGGPVQGKPLVAQLPDGNYALITEAALYDYSGMRLNAQANRTFTVDFTEGAAGFSTDQPTTPWRVVLWANSLQTLVNTQTINHLNPPPDESLFADVSYIKPGRSVWSWLTRDSAYMEPEKEREFIDHAALLDFEYTLIDEGWERLWPDKWRQLRELCAYARQKEVGVWIWKHSGQLRDPLVRDHFLDSVVQAGAVGVKTDFMDSEAKELVDFEIDFLRACAKRKLMVNFHGCHAPTGESKTFPNELTREGVRGLELNIHPEGPITAAHNAALPFTRFVIGHGDYTPGLFSKPGNTTWGHQLADMYVFHSPLFCLADNPAFIINDKNLSQVVPWLKELPVVWDETRVLAGSEIGKLAIIARRKEETWYIAAINGENQAKRIDVDLGFLDNDDGYAVEMFTDEKGFDRRLKKEVFRSADALPETLDLAPNGGVVLRIAKQVQPTADDQVIIENGSIKAVWNKQVDGWHIEEFLVKSDQGWVAVNGVNGEYTLLYSELAPDTSATELYQDGKRIDFPESIYKYNIPVWEEITRPVQLNTAGVPTNFYPSNVEEKAGALIFNWQSEIATMHTSWSLDPTFPTDVIVEMTLEAKQSGYFSMASPTLSEVDEKELSWGTIPGFYQGDALENDFVKAYAYGHGIPDKPVLVRERTATTLAPIISMESGISVAAVAEPGTGRDPWKSDKNTHDEWLLGLSLMNRKGQLSPTLYHPVLGEEKSWLEAGERISWKFRFSVQHADWFQVYKHVVNDVYGFDHFLSLKDPKESLTDRILHMRNYSVDDETSKWMLKEYQGDTLGAQAYLGGVLDSDKDAMKNSDYGAMWMLAQIMDDRVLKQTRLPYARNFKLLQQQNTDGFFKGAAIGQYYLYKSGKFTEEWGNYVEPIGLTYYVMMDAGNMLLFDPDDEELKAVLRNGAEKLLDWMSDDGQWQIAYDHATEEPLFTELTDLRPTFYGLLVAYRMLGDEKYLDAARKGADWYIQHAVDKGHFLGVCGDNRFVPDFATVQSAQALLDLYELTDDERYRDAAIRAAKFYTQSIYTHPIPSDSLKNVGGKKRYDWQIAQAGLSFEHGGSIGSANRSGPILLASHAGLFVRMYQLTNEPMFLSMARAAVWGRDAFVDEETHVASYYWRAMDNGPGSFPHHAWWQIGLLTDYLLSEIDLRSNGAIHFPSGFITPKVGPHKTYGFAPGTVFGQEADLYLRDGVVKGNNPRIDYMCALAEGSFYVLLLNNSTAEQTVTIAIDSGHFFGQNRLREPTIELLDNQGVIEKRFAEQNALDIEIAGFGLKIIKINL
ncbi:glycoside hydrolase family 97 catalytic domain-containing protein [Parapedobacter tibetensis]|uniref:glycoside hydrolase family 97 catalytic domain-containing protein n=1 Tax=Parapedobacter tibetensis TaxID=2972951 RepID=UPI00214DBA72|nr:glycoside hydrolase family 97 catalytic domain-containing protein [Parapedobacter tibetensis]